jgi:hypothetical protein
MKKLATAALLALMLAAQAFAGEIPGDFVSPPPPRPASSTSATTSSTTSTLLYDLLLSLIVRS